MFGINADPLTLGVVLVIVGLVAYRYGAKLLALLPNAGGLFRSSTRGDVGDFRAFQSLATRAVTRKNPEALKCLDTLLPMLFGSHPSGAETATHEGAQP